MAVLVVDAGTARGLGVTGREVGVVHEGRGGACPCCLDALIAACGLGRATPRSLRLQAVDLYETTPGATVRRIAQDPGVEPGPLRQWLARYRTGRKTGADGRSGLCDPLATRTLPPRPPRCQQVGAL